MYTYLLSSYNEQSTYLFVLYLTDYGGMVNPKTRNLIGRLDHAYANRFEKISTIFCPHRNHTWDLRKSKFKTLIKYQT